ncbi:MAG: tetratricopeptide repeat protein [Bryobacterales bacterium]|nr:tetratricopeptide repeat protein [Bryobacterales bacterium]
MDPFRKVKMAVRNVVPGFNLFDSGPDPAEGERLLALGNFAEAEQFFLRVLDQLGERGHRRLSHSKILFALANARFHQKKYSSAKEAALATLEHLDAERPTLELADTHDLLATIFGELKEAEDSVPHLEKALDAQTRIKPVDHGAIIQRRRKLATGLESIGKVEEAVAQLREASSVALRECGPEHQLTGDCEAELGRCLSLQKNFQEALEHLQAALHAHLITPGSESEEVAKDYQLLATAYQETEELETAVIYYEKALRLRERQLGGSSADYATLLMSFATAQSLRGSYGAAVELLQQAVGKFEGLRDDRLGPALESLGTVYVLSGRVDDGIRSLKRARKIWENQPDQNSERLSANTQLFETVSGYLNPRDATLLMQSIQSDGSFEPRPDPRNPAKKAQPAAQPEAVAAEPAAPEIPYPELSGQPAAPKPAYPGPMQGVDPNYPSYLPPEFGGLPPGTTVTMLGGGPAGAPSYTAGTAGYNFVDAGGYPGESLPQGYRGSAPAGPPSPGGPGGEGFHPSAPAGASGYATGGYGSGRTAHDGGPVYSSGWSGSFDPELQGGWYGTTADGIPIDPELAYLYQSSPGASGAGGPVAGDPAAPVGHSTAGIPAEMISRTASGGVSFAADTSAPLLDASGGGVPAGAVAAGGVAIPAASQPPADGRPAEPGPQNSALLTDMLALRDALSPTPAPPPPTRSAALSGWEEMAFDFLPN